MSARTFRMFVAPGPGVSILTLTSLFATEMHQHFYPPNSLKDLNPFKLNFFQARDFGFKVCLCSMIFFQLVNESLLKFTWLLAKWVNYRGWVTSQRVMSQFIRELTHEICKNMQNPCINFISFSFFLFSKCKASWSCSIL